MSNDEDVRPGVALTSRALVRHGRPVIPVSGELHYSRVPRHRWAERLRQMRAGGITVVASYVFWLHHVGRRGEPRFDGNLDLAAFLDEVRAAGLDMVLRIGPWCHGESRNGGFPDWVQAAPVAHRTDDPAYLELVSEWFAVLASRIRGAELLGIQLENELYDQPGHLVTLKRLARSAGLTAPLWTATAWGGADLPAGEVLPLYGGYGDGFWVDAGAPWDPTFRDHFFFSHVWDDPGIGADLRRTPASAHPASLPPFFPPATCELGGGMATAYHRRPWPAALDVATIAHCKIGNGSAWQGYYMYAGGTNPPHAQESHATGYPNDMPPLGYDFHAPIGESGLLAASHAELRRQHAFLAAFGDRLAEMPSTLPAVRPHGVDDRTTMRYALRSDGDSGFLFLAWHQPHFPLATYRGAQFQVVLGTDTPGDASPGAGADAGVGVGSGVGVGAVVGASGEAVLTVPAVPVDIPAGTIACWPLRLAVGSGRLDWATASVLTVLPGEVPTLVLVAAEGVDVTYSVGGVVAAATPGLVPVQLGAFDLLVLPASVAGAIWVDEDGPRRRLLLSDDELRWGGDGRVSVHSTGVPDVRVYEPVTGEFVALRLDGREVGGDVGGLEVGGTGGSGFEAAADVVAVREAVGTVPVAYGKFDGRQSAPSPETFDELAAVYRLTVPERGGVDLVLRIDWAGDVGQLRVDGRAVTDRFWDGSAWTVNLRDAGWLPGAELTLHLLPLAAGSTVSLPTGARDRLLAADGQQLLALDAVRVLGRVTWHELGHRVRKTMRYMADGREIIYFDDTSLEVPRTAIDLRDLSLPEAQPEMRLDPLTGEWIAIAAHRNDRTYQPSADADPLAPTVPGGAPTEVAEAAYDVVVFENRFPAFSPRAANAGRDAAPMGVTGGGELAAWATGTLELIDGDPMWPVRPASGRTEVVCFSSEAEGSFGSLTPSRARTVIDAWADRTAALGRMPGVEHVFVFENRGREIGVTLPHPHGQIYAFPFVPPKVRRMLTRVASHPRLFAEILAAERRAGTRIVASSEHWTAYVPAAARWPVEVHIAPHRDVADLPGLTDDERDDLAVLYLDVLGRLDRYYEGPEPLPYISGVFQAPVREGRDLFRLHLQVFSVLRAPGKLKYLAGVESAMGSWISDTTPERVAERLRAVVAA
ncbi:galactose-1-phosphate uridylyltransferase [Actinoplanes bogorensis]|uniref:Galactose-1-phosphate uridylyltransferase n=2 Tax=Paractinoplanes bogorensis TaxID=1610840 RepID=A0ABS5Z1X7_9ACTN|nr:galactose-1-phosphate uridylyltransferase [Actinoplanes bogorensis]